jgi:hypothetical protein
MTTFETIFTEDIKKSCWLGDIKAKKIFDEFMKVKELDGFTN